MRTFNDVRSLLRTGPHKMWLALLFGVLSLLCQNISGPGLTRFNGFFPQAMACLVSGLVYLYVVIRNGETFRDKKRGFWKKTVVFGVPNALITVFYVLAVAAGLPVAVLTAVMGGGMISAILISGWKETNGPVRDLMLLSALVTLAGVLAFPVSAGGGAPIWGVIFALAAAVSLCVFTLGFQQAAKATGELHIATGILLAAGILGAFSVTESVLAGHLKGGEWLASPWTFLAMLALGLAWMFAATWLNRRAANGLSDTGYAAIQPWASPVALFTQIVLLGQGATLGTWIADGLIVAGGLVAFRVELHIQKQRREETTEMPHVTHVPALLDAMEEAASKNIHAAVRAAYRESVRRKCAAFSGEELARIAGEVVNDPAVQERAEDEAREIVTSEMRGVIAGTTRK